MILKLNYQVKHAVNLFGGNNVKNSFQDLVIPKPDITIFTDASETGCGKTDGHNAYGGQWAEHERMHINVLKLKAAFIGICTYCHNRSFKHKKYDYGVLKLIHLSLQLTYQENKILK